MLMGWAIIAVVTLCIFMNLIVMLIEAGSHCKLLYTRRQNKLAHMAKKSQITPGTAIEMANVEKAKPAIEAIPEAIEEVSSMKEESLGIVGLPEPEQPDLLNPADDDAQQISVKKDNSMKGSSRVHPEPTPQIEEELKECREPSVELDVTQKDDNKSMNNMSSRSAAKQ